MILDLLRPATDFMHFLSLLQVEIIVAVCHVEGEELHGDQFC